MTQAALGSLLATLRDDLAGRAGLADVTVQIIAADGASTWTTDRIVLYRGDEIDRPVEWAAVGGQRFEDTIELPVRIGVYRADRSAETNAETILDRLDELVGEIFAQLIAGPPVVGDQTTEALVSDREYRLTIPDRGGWLGICDLTITLTGRGSL